MQAGCIHCGQQHLLDDGVLTKHSKVQFRCTKCRKTTVVEVNRRVDETVAISPMPSFARSDVAGKNSGATLEENPELASDTEVSVLVTTGPEMNKSFTMSKVRAVIGRKGADIALNDPEISRHHCLIEVRDGFVNLKDLDSTNGTFFGEERVRAAMLKHGDEFRVGSSTIRLTYRVLQPVKSE
jgi:hypothetical protein